MLLTVAGVSYLGWFWLVRHYPATRLSTFSFLTPVMGVLAGALLLVPVAAILVASMRLRAVDVALNAQYRGPHQLPCHARYDKGDEMGWFEHGSTILVFTPPGFALCHGVENGHRIRMGEALLERLAR